MSWDFIFPTREGSAVGGALERRMLNKVGGAETIRTEIQRLPDGSEVMLRTRGGHPEFTVKKAAKAVQEVYSSWAWPWHGVYRFTDNKLENSTGDAAPRGAPPSAANFNFIPSTQGIPFAAIAPPKKANPAGSVWVNYAAITGGTLFGEAVTMDTWLYTAGGKCWVVVMTKPTQFSIQLKFYKLDNWVAGMNKAAAVDFVAYDGPPTPYMVSAVPSGSPRTADKTIDVAMPDYYSTPNTTITVKRSDVSRSGAKIILAYEIAGRDDLSVPQIPISFAPAGPASYLQLEDQWVELTITGTTVGDLAASVETIYSGSTVDPLRQNTHVVIATNEDQPPPKDTFTGTATVIDTATYSVRIGVMYDENDIATPITLSYAKSANATYDFTQTTTPSAAGWVGTTITTKEYLFAMGANTYSVSSTETTDDNINMSAGIIGTNSSITNCSVSVGERVLSGVFTTTYTTRYGSIPWLSNPWWVSATNPNTGLKVNIPGDTHGNRAVLRFGKGDAHKEYNWFNATDEFLVASPQPVWAALAQYNSYASPPVNSPFVTTATGYKKYFGYANDIAFVSGVTGSTAITTSRIRIAKVAFNYLAVEWDVDGSIEPLAFVSPQGFIPVAAGAVTPANYRVGAAYNKVDSAIAYAVSGKRRQYV